MAKFDKKSIRIIFNIALAVFIIAGVSIILYFVFKDDCDPNKVGYDKKGNLNPKCNGSDDNGGGGGNGVVSTYCSSTATLDKGKLLKLNMTRNQEVCELQRLLGILRDGYFGTMTEGALEKRIGKKETTLFNYIACVQGGVC